MSLPEGTPYVKGRWMVSGPENPDGSGWSLCLLAKRKCVKCIASFRDRQDALKACRLYYGFDQPHAVIREVINSVNTQLREHGIDMQFDPAAYIQRH